MSNDIAAACIEYARKRFAAPSNDTIEIDDRPKLSRADNGVWVAAWVWVPFAEIPGATPEPGWMDVVRSAAKRKVTS